MTSARSSSAGLVLLQSIASSKGPAADRAPVSSLAPVNRRFVTLHIMLSRKPFATAGLGADERSLLVWVVGPLVRTHVEQSGEQTVTPWEGASESLCRVGLRFAMAHVVSGCGPLSCLHVGSSTAGCGGRGLPLGSPH